MRLYSTVYLPDEEDGGHDADPKDGQPDHAHICQSPVYNEHNRHEQDQDTPHPNPKARRILVSTVRPQE